VKIYRRDNVPCVSQTKIWKGFFEAHFMSGKEINDKYPIQNKLWKFVHIGPYRVGNLSYDGIYCAKYNDFHTHNLPYCDPWYRELKTDDPVYDDNSIRRFHTSVESNAVLLQFDKTKII